MIYKTIKKIKNRFIEKITAKNLFAESARKKYSSKFIDRSKYIADFAIAISKNIL